MIVEALVLINSLAIVFIMFSLFNGSEVTIKQGNRIFTLEAEIDNLKRKKKKK